MRSRLACCCVLLLGLCGWLTGQGDGEARRLRIRLLENGRPATGILRLTAAGKPISLLGALDRLQGLKATQDHGGWYVVPAEGISCTLPSGHYRAEALAGLETARTVREFEVAPDGAQAIDLPLVQVLDLAPDGWAAGNTHLHLMKLTAEQAETYLRGIPPADRLRVLFLSYLERKPQDRDYITNRYRIGRLKEFDATGVLFDNGEEHRHNFLAFGEGYGHVMFLNLKELVRPVSIGPGIMQDGFDDRPLLPGIEAARKQGGTVLWCHNTNGHEDVLHALAGRLDALNVFDGSRTGTFEDAYYRYLNVGVRLPISTGTDWFLYDFARVYAKVPGELSIPAWLDAVKAGRCQATNGPLLSLKVEGHDLGEVVKLDGPGRLRVEASGRGRHDFGHLELVRDGVVVHRQRAEKQGEAFTATLDRVVAVDQPGWFAVRIATKNVNEFGKELFAHTSPVYVDMKGRGPFVVEDALVLAKRIEEGEAAVRARGKFSKAEARDAVLALYSRGLTDLQTRINRARP